MQKLIILDTETGIAHIINADDYDPNMEELEDFVEGKGFSVARCDYMVALEINDTTK